MSGLFVSFEGVDGTGKSTQAERLGTYLESTGHTAILTREPGGTRLGAAIRRLLLADDMPDITPRTEALLFAADRAQHVAKVIRPALQQGHVVVCDRYVDSSIAYQSGGRGLTGDGVRRLSMWATGGLLPDRTYLLDMDATTSHMRLTHEADRMEGNDAVFHRRTRDMFLTLARMEPDRFRVIDASRPVDKVWADVRADIDLLLRRLDG